MYYCPNCKIALNVKPYDSRGKCNHCDTNTIKITKKDRTNVTISNIFLNDVIGDLLIEFDKYVDPGTRFQYGRTNAFAQWHNVNIDKLLRPFGVIVDNMETLITLSRLELQQLTEMLFSRNNKDDYYYVKVQTSMFDHPIMVNINIVDIVEWHKDSELSFNLSHDKIWALRATSDNSKLIEIKDTLLQNYNNTDYRWYNRTNMFIQ